MAHTYFMSMHWYLPRSVVELYSTKCIIAKIFCHLSNHGHLILNLIWLSSNTISAWQSQFQAVHLKRVHSSNQWVSVRYEITQLLFQKQKCTDTALWRERPKSFMEEWFPIYRRIHNWSFVIEQKEIIAVCHAMGSLSEADESCTGCDGVCPQRTGGAW